MNSDVELNILERVPWHKLSDTVKQSLGNSKKEYELAVINYSVKNQLKYRNNLVRHYIKEQKYYEDILAYCRESLLLYPYHLSYFIVKGMRVTPFQYYIKVLETIMDSERSYDSLPNFTAADCLRLLGVGRNEYIDLMNQCRSRRKLFRKKNIRDLLPLKPIDVSIDPWWVVETGCIVEDDMKLVSEEEKKLIDYLIDNGSQKAGDLDYDTVHSLYKKGLVYLEVPIASKDQVVVPPLKGFVMNRVLGDNFETLLYKIFVSIDEHTTVGELAGILQINLKLVKQAVSLYCRLGFAKKKLDISEQFSCWSYTGDNKLEADVQNSPVVISSFSKVYNTQESNVEDDCKTKIAFLFDSTLTAFLMMGNLSPGLKTHAVTMFEVGKLTDESLDSFLCELEKVNMVRDDSEGEARRYFEHALVLRHTVLALRHRGLDLVRCESLQSLDKNTCARLLRKNYGLLVSMAPLSGEVTPITCDGLPHLGPSCPQAHSPWFKLFLYHITGSGPPSILFSRGTQLYKLPSMFKSCDEVLVTSWSHDSAVIPISNLLFTLNDALSYSSVLVQVNGNANETAETHLIPFPFTNLIEIETGNKNNKKLLTFFLEINNIWSQHPAIIKLVDELDLTHNCGYITMVKVKSPNSPSQLPSKDSLALPLSSEQQFQPLETPATPSCVDAWIETLSTEKEELSVKNYIASPNEDQPINGIINKECAKILEQIVDGLESSDSSPSKNSESKIEIQPCLLPLRVGLTDKRSNNPPNLSEWSLLDCCFGIPLFDADVNKTICETVINKLIDPSSLSKLIASNESLTTRLSSFIKQVQSWGDDQLSVEQDSKNYNKNENCCPVGNVMFYDGQLSPWDDK